MNKLLQLGLCVLTLFSVLVSHAQNIKSVNFNSVEVSEAEAKMAGTAQIQATGAKYFLFDLNGLQNQLDGMMHREHENSGFIAQISLPHPDGTFHLYNAKENSTMHPELAEKFKNIGSYDAQGVDNQAFVKWDLTPQGLHAMIMIPGESTIFIDPLIAGQSDYYIVYNKEGFITDKIRDCSFNSDISQLESKQEATSGSVKSFGSCDLRTYRLALSATGEYTIFQGGTLALAQAAQVTTMNRVNGVFEKDMAITMVIIPNNDLIIYTSTADPFTNGNPGSMINENQSNTDAVIGNGNYDIGHVFGTNSGGLAGLGVVCNNAGKARGVTGSSAPTGDSFDIDYVAHEMGHQFGGNHTFNNSCNNNRNNGTAVEPGSGTTIMAYAGICAPDIQNNSDDHFSGISLEEFGNEILSAGHTCEVITPLANIAPVISSTIGAVTVPANTPFALTAVASDADGDLITYNWEQMDTEISTQSPVANATGGPNFRSIPSLTSPTRFFPNLTDLANGGPYTWEVLPSVTRTMNFRVTVRDNSNGAGGCNDHSDITLTTDANSGPFIVTYPNATGINWMALTSETVTWDVANTDVAPVSCSNVDIFLSIDGGLTYPITLATNTPNDGTQIVTVPNSATTQARVMVMNSNGTFFDISDNNFTITALANDYTLSASPASVSICQPSDATYTIDIGSLDGYSDLVSLSVSGIPAGATSSITPVTVTPAGSATLLISNTAGATPGTYTITVDATSTTGPKSFDVELIIGNSSPASIGLSSPANGAVNESLPTNFNWISSSELGASYELEIATDIAFSSVTDGASGLSATSYVSNGLQANTTYYWRVRYTTSCGVSDWSTVFSFTTNGCSEFVSTDTPILIPAAGTPTITSIINIPAGGTINDVNVLNINGTHAWIKNLTVTLTSPLGTIVPLFTQVCNNQDDFNLGFDDASGLTALPCPPIGGLSYQPEGLLSSFNGENSTGNWTLTIIDGNNNNGGELLGWALEVCVDPSSCIDPELPITSGTTAICSGSTTALSVASGNLNDATNWEWYETSCGGTAIGTGASVVVSPTVNTSYFVRGEGGCVIPGACSQIDVIVNPIFNETASASICQGDTYTFGSLSLTAAGTYTELFTSTGGCDSTVVLTLDVIASFNETASASICQGDTYTFGSLSLTAAGTYTELFTSTGGCDSTVVLTLDVIASFNETASASICQGDTYTFGSLSLTAAGTYTELFTSTGGCDSTVILTLDVIASFNETASASICQGDTYTFGSLSLTAAGTYTELFTSTGGCDSTVVLTLDVIASFNETASASICQGDTYTFGSLSLTAAGTYTELFTSTGGCDSLVVLTLDVIASFNETASASICQGDTYTFGSLSLTAAGTYTELFTSTGGCDSTVVLTLDVIASFNETASASICQGDTYTFGSLSLTAAGTYTELFTSIGGCDSLVVLTLDVIASFNETASASICQGDTYTFGSLSLTAAGTYTELFTSVGGCDSLVVLTLDVISSFNETASASICQGDTYTFGSLSLTTAGTYTELFTSIGGCDSLVVLTLDVIASFNETASASICQGDTYTFGSLSLTAAGTYTELFTSIGGCDSLVVLTLDVISSFNETASASICQGDTYTFGSLSLTTAGTYTELFTSIGGCDSLVVLTLDVIASFNETASASICQGDTYTFGSLSLTAAGTYTELFTSVGGCDSLVVLTLDVISSFNETASASICQGDTYTFGSLSLTTSGTYSELFTSTGGCDSIVVLTLSVLPTYTFTEAVSICEGETYVFPDGIIGTVTEAHISNLTSINGCDSTVITALTVNSSYFINETVAICSGSTYTFPDGSTGAISQTHTSAFTTGNGCDSIIVTTLTINPIYNSTQSATICEGDSYVFPDGNISTTAQVYTSLLSTADGCDSIIVTTLTVNPAYNGAATATICAGETYTFPDGSTSTVAQTQTSILTSLNGCDSSIVTTLSVQSIDVSVTNVGTTLTANQAGADYVWIDCADGNSPIAGEIGASFTPVSNVGNYAVIVTMGSCSDTSDCILIDQTGIDENNINQVLIYPNPTSNQVNIKWEGDIDFIEITDTKGKLLNRFDNIKGNAIDVSLVDYSSGVYFIHLQNISGRKAYQVIKK